MGCSSRCRTRRGGRAEGPPLVKAANYLTHLELDWDSPVWRHWMALLTRGRRLVRYDERGGGLSDWDVADLSFEAWVTDLEAVVEASGSAASSCTVPTPGAGFTAG